MKKIFLVLLVLTASITFAQSKDVDAYKNASAIKDPSKKIEAMKNFMNEYPQSTYMPRVYTELVGAFIAVNIPDSAIFYADKYVSTFPPEGRANPYNSVAYTFAQKKIGLDTALVYIKRAVDLAKSRKARNVGQFLDTEAFVLFQQGKFDEALTVQTEAVKGNEGDPSYLGGLATYQAAAGKTTDAILTGAKVILFGDPDYIFPKWNEWVAKEKSTPEEQTKLKKETAEKVVNEILAEQKNPEDAELAKYSAAAFYAKLGVNLDEAKKWTSEGIKNIKNDTPVERKVLLHKTMGSILAAQKDYKNALKELDQVKTFVDPWDADFWFTLGTIHQSMNQNDKALDAYVSSLYAYPAPQIVAASNELIKKMNITEEELQKKIEARGKENETFDPGKSKIKSNGNVLLAELFTGADCNPCQGADVAFDKLMEYYPRNNVALLQFHMHIPAPDPLANPDTWDRYTFYGANYGTPTAIINGKELLTGGGPRSMAFNRFNLYKSTLDNMFSRKPVIKLSGKAVRNGNKVDVSFDVKGKTDSASVFYVVLVDKSVKYTGSNGIDHHIFVVRDMQSESSLNGTIKKSFDVDKIQSEIKSYLDDPSKHPSWRPTFGKANWRARPETLDVNNLAVVGWVQNSETKEVLNSFYVDVK